MVKNRFLALTRYVFFFVDAIDLAKKIEVMVKVFIYTFLQTKIRSNMKIVCSVK